MAAFFSRLLPCGTKIVTGSACSRAALAELRAAGRDQLRRLRRAHVLGHADEQHIVRAAARRLGVTREFIRYRLNQQATTPPATP